MIAGSLRVANSTAARPHPSSAPRHCSPVSVIRARYDGRLPVP